MRECHSIWSGSSELPYYCKPPETIPDVLGVLVVWRQNKNKRTHSQLRGNVCVCMCVCVCVSLSGKNLVNNVHSSINAEVSHKCPTQKCCSIKKEFARDWIAEREGARLPYSTLTGKHQVCITRKGDPALRLLTNRDWENHLFASSVFARDTLVLG